MVSKFNAVLANKLLVLGNELATNGAAVKKHNVLKRIITDTKNTIEYKGRNSMMVESLVSLMLFTNEPRAIRIDPHDRRYCAVECSDIKVGDAEYFAQLKKAFDDPKVQAEFFRQMQEIELGGFHFGTNIPQTAYRTKLQEAAGPSRAHPQALYMFLAEDTPHWAAEDFVVEGRQLREQLSAWMKEKDLDDQTHPAELGKQLSQLGFKAKQVKINKRNIRQYDLKSAEEVAAALKKVGYTV